MVSEWNLGSFGRASECYQHILYTWPVGGKRTGRSAGATWTAPRPPKINAGIIGAGMMCRGVLDWSAIRRTVAGMCMILLLGAACGARQAPVGNALVTKDQPGITAAHQTPVSAATLEIVAAPIAREIVKDHLKSVVVVGAAGPEIDELTYFGMELGDEFSVVLAKQSNEYHVAERSELRDLVKKLNVSEAMVGCGALGNWIAGKSAAESYVVVQMKKLPSGRTEVEGTLYRRDEGDGNWLTVAGAEIDLGPTEHDGGFGALDSDWNKLTDTKNEANSLPGRARQSAHRARYPMRYINAAIRSSCAALGRLQSSTSRFSRMEQRGTLRSSSPGVMRQTETRWKRFFTTGSLSPRWMPMVTRRQHVFLLRSRIIPPNDRFGSHRDGTAPTKD